jgi:glycosyltransferase involved in cell wall biosynthesis
MKNTLVTILIACYNTEAYLPKCLDSLLAQTYRDLQIICIDDASTDGTLRLLQQYAAMDDRIEVVSLDRNQGQAHARNVGFRRARGFLTAFLDSDDWMSADCIGRAVETFKQYERTGCVLLRLVRCYPDGREEPYPMMPFEVMSGKEAFEKSLDWSVHGVYVVRTEIQQRWPYDESCHSYSDDNTTRLHFLASEQVRCCEGTYYYRQRSDSVSHKIDSYYFDYLEANYSMKQQLLQLSVEPSLIDRYERLRWLNIIDRYMTFFHYRKFMSPEERMQVTGRIHRAWSSIDTRRLNGRERWKFGYMPLHFCWPAFRLQEEVYFALRQMIRHY